MGILGGAIVGTTAAYVGGDGESDCVGDGIGDDAIIGGKRMKNRPFCDWMAWPEETKEHGIFLFEPRLVMMSLLAFFIISKLNSIMKTLIFAMTLYILLALFEL